MVLLILTLAFLVTKNTVVCQTTAGGYIMNGYGNNMYGSKTAYFWIHPVRAPVRENSLMTIQFEGQTCSAIHVNVLSRHGARYTSAKDMRAFTTLQSKLQASLGYQSYSFISTWQNRYPEDMADMLTSLGQQELDYIGEKHGIQLKDLFKQAVNGNEFSDESIKFGATKRVRTQDSALYFQNALSRVILGQNKTSVAIHIRDKILRFYDDCKKYEEVTASDPELTKFQNGPEMQMVREDVTRMLQLNTTMTVGDVKMLWRLCATELAIMNNEQWCTLMNNTHREILEYENDIEDYNGRLYGHPVTGKMACPLVKDIFTEMDSAITAYDSGNSRTVGVFQFGHSDTVVDFAAGMGFFNDKSTFRADNYPQLQNRTFNNAIVDHFSTHFTFILYNCGYSGVHNYALRLLFNGEPLNFPGCNSDICRYDKVRKSYGPSIDQCDWYGVCDVNQPGVPIGK